MPFVGSAWVDHRLKIWPEHFASVLSGEKRAEFRKDDRTPAFAKGDFLLLDEFEPDLGVYTDDHAWAKVTHVARGGVIPQGYALLSIECLTVRKEA